MAGERDLEILLKLQDKEALSRLHTALKQVESESKKSTDSMNLSWAGLASKYYLAREALQPVIGFMHEAVAAAMEQEDATNRLNVALQNQGTFSKDLSTSLQSMATEFQRSSRFSDEAILGVMQTLVSMGNVAPGQLQKVTQAVMDFSTATRKDLESSAMMFAKASEGQSAAFKKLGYEVDAFIPKSQMLGVVVDETNRKFGGSAKGDLNTYSGAVKQLGNSWGDFLEEIGNLVIKSPAVNAAMRKMSTDVSELTKTMQDIAPEFQGFIDKVFQLGTSTSSGFAGIGDQLRGMFDGLWDSVMGAGGIGKTISEQIAPSITETNQQVLDNQDLLNQQRMEKELTFQEQLAAVHQQFNETDYQERVLTEERKIETQRQQLLAWYDEKTATTMAYQQQETEMLSFALDTQKKAHESLWSVASKARDSFTSGLSAALMNLMKGTGTLKEAFVDLGWQMVKILMDWVVQTTINFAIAKAMQAAHLAATIPIATATASAWAPAAAMVSLATFGANAAAAVAGMTTTVATAQTLALLSAIPGLAEGGSITSGGSVLVGEQGPELLNLPKGASVIPLGRSSQNTVINIVVNINNPTGKIDDELMARMKSEISEFLAVELERL